MLRTDKPIYKVVLLFNLLLILAAVVLSIISMCGEGATATRFISAIVRLFALLFAGFYITLGYRKDAAMYYKIFGIIYIVNSVIELIACLLNTFTVIDIIFIVLSIAGIAVLTFVKDLGKKRSFIICAILVILQIVCTVLVFLEGDPFVVIINSFMGIDLACLLGIMTFAKYLDKAERGTK